MAGGNGHKTTEEQILEEIRKGFAEVNKRLDQVVENTGSHWREHEERLRAIETKLGITTR